MTNTDRLKEVLSHARQEVARVIIGQADVVDRALIAIFTGQHALIEGVPGVAKTLLVKTMNGSEVIAKIAGIESTAKITSVKATRQITMNSGVAMRRPFSMVKNFSPSKPELTGITLRRPAQSWSKKMPRGRSGFFSIKRP